MKNKSPVPDLLQRSMVGAGLESKTPRRNMGGEEKKNERVDNPGGGKCSACGRESNTEVEDLFLRESKLLRFGPCCYRW